MQRASPATATEPQQFVDAVHSGSGGQDLDGYATRHELGPKSGIGPHTAECPASDDEQLRVIVQQPAQIFHAQHVARATARTRAVGCPGWVLGPYRLTAVPDGPWPHEGEFPRSRGPAGDA